MKFVFLALLCLSLMPIATAEVTTPALLPLVQYDFADAEDLGKDRFGIQPLTNIRKVTQGVVADGVYSAVFNGRNALAAKTLADRDITDGLSTFTVTLWAKHPASQSAHSFLLGTGVAYSTTGFGMGFYMGNDAYILPLGGIQDGAYAVNYRFPYETTRYKNQTEWNLFSLTVDGKKASFSVNGEVFNVNGIPENGLSLENLGQTLTLGGIYNNDHDVFYNGFVGEIADVRIYGAALTGDQLTALHTMGIGGGHLPLTAPAIASASAPDLGGLTVTAKTVPSQVLTQLDALPLPFTTTDGEAHADGHAIWTAVEKEEAGFLVTGLLYHPSFPNPNAVTVQARVPFGASRSIQLPCIFSDGMVLQRHENVRLFGNGGSVGDIITATFGDLSVNGTFTADGWEIILPPMEACKEGKTLTIAYTRQGDAEPHQSFTLEDVLVGEVWLCSGQSNMAYTLREMLSNPGAHPDFYRDYQSIENWGMLRFYSYPYGEANAPQMNYSRLIPWQSPKNIGQCANLSGTALAYATHLQKMLGEDIPVAMIISSVGGACIEEWLDAPTMKTLPSHAASMGKKDSRFFNAMINPFAGYTVKGILWYQGCANAMWPDDYKDQFEAYTDLYRALFHNDHLPVIVMQLPQYDEDLFPVFRSAQWDLMSLIDEVYTVCGIDLGDPDNIHPTDKFPFGARAAGVALQYVYQKAPVEGLPYGLSPFIDTITRTENGLVLTVSNAAQLTGPEEIEGFMIMKGQRWAEVTAELQDQAIFIPCDAQEVSYINYLQDTSFPWIEHVYNEYGLPLAPLGYTAIR